MERSLSILLPIHNAQTTLRASVTRILDLAAELTSRFEVLILDDASTDHSAEVAHELTVRYPQVQLTRFAQQQGLAAAVRQGLERTRGEIICIHEGSGTVEVADIRRLWQLRNDEDLVLARHSGRGAAREGWVERLLGHGANETHAEGSGFHLLRREALHALQEGEALAASQHEVRLRSAGKPAPRRPNFMDKVRSLTRGE